MLALPGAGAGAVLPSGTFAVMPCPGPDDINWPTLWCTWQMVRGLKMNAAVGWCGRMMCDRMGGGCWGA